MASIETNIKFVKELLYSEKITTEQSKEVLELLAEEIFNLIQLKSNENANKVNSKINFIEHNPYKVIQTLKKFTYDQKFRSNTFFIDIFEKGILRFKAIQP